MRFENKNNELGGLPFPLTFGCGATGLADSKKAKNRFSNNCCEPSFQFHKSWGKHPLTIRSPVDTLQSWSRLEKQTSSPSGWMA
jgi:hypothetical protein